MGICFSSKSSSSTFDCIRVVHLNGYVEDFEAPKTVKHITGNHPKHYVCTMAQLLPSSKQLAPETQLQPGKLYFLLPYSLFQSETSPANMISIGTRLAAVAKSNRAQKVSKNSGSLVTKEDPKAVFKIYKEQNSCSDTSGSWKPLLDSITEKSMEHGTETDLVSKLGS